MEEFLAGLTAQTKASLIKSIGQIVMDRPECLSVFGVPGFEEEDNDEDEEESDWGHGDW